MPSVMDGKVGFKVCPSRIKLIFGHNVPQISIYQLLEVEQVIVFHSELMPMRVNTGN